VGGVATITKDHENEIRRYLFGQLPPADEENLELRLLTDPAFVEEFDTVVDEVTDQYVRDELEGSERKGFEKRFLTTAQGQQKVRFTSELLERAAAERGPAVVKPVPEPGFFERVRAFWQVHSLRVVGTAAAVVIIAVGVVLIWPSGSTNYAMLSLSISTANRGEGPAPAKVRLESGTAGVEVNLAIPEQAKGAKDYRVKLVSADLSEHDLKIDKRDDQTVTVKIPASDLPRGNYAIQMFSIASDGSEQRIRGSYFFNVE
jgi:methionine-rich copper-binding protein CopC